MDKTSMEIDTAGQPPVHSTTEAEPIAMNVIPLPVYYPNFRPMIVVHSPPTVTDTSQRMNCPHCQADIMTDLEYTSGNTSIFCSVLLFFLGCWCWWCPPYRIESLMDIDHYCPTCDRHIGTYKRYC